MISGRPGSFFGLLFASLIVSIGTFWAFQKGAPDFSVFHEAWRLIGAGRGAEVYHATPDRFLYAPGFAWIFAPLGFLPRGIALALWCFAKAAVVGLIVRGFSLALNRGKNGLGMAAWGVVLLAKPLLIDFQYGQVNTFILAACVWALLSHFRRGEGDLEDLLSWAVLAIAALAKVFPLPLLLVPFFVTSGISRKRLLMERGGIIAGLSLIALLPLLTQGWHGTLELYSQWKDALISRGLPLESHNQSFSAFLHHYFSGTPTHIIAQGIDHPVVLGSAWLNLSTISALSVACMLIAAGVLLGWIMAGSTRKPLQWIAITIGLLILPSHLVWKPYFLMGIPAAILAVSRLPSNGPLLAVIFALVNFTGFDWVGGAWGARFEAGAILLWAHLLLLGLVYRQQRKRVDAVA